MKIIGIYKITSPTGRIYIGQSIDIIRRFDTYKKLRYPKAQPKLYASLIKHGPLTHTFEVIEECSEDQLNDRERYYISLYNTFDTERGLNLKFGSNRDSRLSIETRAKISSARKGCKAWITGLTHSAETREKIRLAHIGNTKKRGYVTSEETKRKISESLKGRKYSHERVAASVNGKRKKKQL